MVVVIRRTNRTETALVEQSDRIRSLYEVSSMAGLKLNEQIDEMLNLGCRFLKMDCGRVNKIDPEKNKIPLKKNKLILSNAGDDVLSG